MPVRHFVFRPVEINQCPVAVVRLFPDGTEEAFTRDLRWQPSDRLARLGGELPPTVFEVAPGHAEQMVVDLIVRTREDRYEVPYGTGRNSYAWFRHRADVLDLDKACALMRSSTTTEEFLPDGTWARPSHTAEYTYFQLEQWGNPRSPVRVAISAAEEERLTSQGLAKQPEWFVVPAHEARPRRAARELADGTTEVFTDELRWEPYEWAGFRRKVEYWRVMPVLAETVERVRAARPVPFGYANHYSVLFEDFVHAEDLLLARDLLRRPNGVPELEEEWSSGDRWGRSFRLREMIREHNWYDLEVPVTEAEAEEYVRVRNEWAWLRGRAYGRLGN